MTETRSQSTTKEEPDHATSNQLGFSTRSVWAGEHQRGLLGATVTPVFHGVTFAYDDVAEWQAVAQGERPGHIYSRNTNPTVTVFEHKVRELEGAEAATSFSSGMAAISGTLFSLLAPQQRVVTIKDTYGGTNKLFTDYLPRWGVAVQLCDTADQQQIEAAIAEGCDLVYLESPTNPVLKILDLARLAQAAKQVGATVVVDNTFATPINQRPLELGADLVVYSATKYLGGHSHALGGAVCGDRDRIRSIFQFREINGASLDPTSAFHLIQGMKTLELRVRRQNDNAMQVARYLSEHPRIEQVFYPGLPSHPGHDVARAQMSGFGGVLAFSLPGSGGGNDGDLQASSGLVRSFLENLQLAHCAASLGSVSTLAGPPAMTSHVELSPAERAAAGIPETLIRYSVGIEDAADLIQDLDRALNGLPA